MLVLRFVCEVACASGFASHMDDDVPWDTRRIVRKARPNSIALEKGNLGTHMRATGSIHCWQDLFAASHFFSFTSSSSLSVIFDFASSAFVIDVNGRAKTSALSNSPQSPVRAVRGSKWKC